MTERKFIPLIDRGIFFVGGQEIWNSLSENEKKRVLFDICCPAGGYKEERANNDGSRYWEKDRGLK